MCRYRYPVVGRLDRSVATNLHQWPLRPKPHIHPDSHDTMWLKRLARGHNNGPGWNRVRTANPLGFWTTRLTSWVSQVLGKLWANLYCLPKVSKSYRLWKKLSKNQTDFLFKDQHSSKITTKKSKSAAEPKEGKLRQAAAGKETKKQESHVDLVFERLLIDNKKQEKPTTKELRQKVL